MIYIQSFIVNTGGPKIQKKKHRRTKQRSKISCFQNPAVKYFALYLSNGVLAKESASIVSSLDLAIMLTSIDKDYTFSVGAQIARRIDNNSSKGRTYGGIFTSQIFLAQDKILIASDDVLLPSRRLDFNTLKAHNFFEPGSTYGDFNYRLLFEEGDKRPRSIHLPAPFFV